MSSRSLFFAGAAVAIAALVPASQAAAGCQMVKLAELPVTFAGLRPMIPAKVNGVEAKFLLDSGAFFSSISAEAAARMKVRILDKDSVVVTGGIDGWTDAHIGEVREFTFADLPLKNVKFLVGGADVGGDGVGLLGENLISFADVEYDLANGVVRFFKPLDCKDADLAYWAGGAASVIPFEPTSAEAPHITGKATLNGKPIKVMFDTGASRSFLTDLAAKRAGVRRDAAGVTDAGLAVGIAGGGVESWVAPFDSFELGDEKIRNTRIWVGKSAFDIDMLLGADFFLSHRVLVSHSQHRLYFTYSGGPVFRLDQAGANRAAATGETAGTTPTTQAAIPDDADALSRRGSASMARRDYAGAAADFGRAIALKPNDPQPYVDRARARLATGDRRAALDDLNHALKLKPDHVEALLQRGALHAGEDGEDAAAETDFAAAAKAAPDDARLPLRIAATWTGESRWDKATSWYGVWLAAHPKDPGRWDVLNNRCWARAMWGHELEQALEDCDAAVRLSERSANSLDSRGLVRLRLGKLKEAVADYDAALRKQPKLEWSLYGRGLARKRLGDVAGGEADLKAALKLEPDLAERAKGIGLVP